MNTRLPRFTYFMRTKSLGFWKIGWTRVPQLRLGDIKSCFGIHDLEYAALYRFEDMPETQCLSIFGAHSVGGEWFLDAPQFRMFIARNKKLCQLSK